MKKINHYIACFIAAAILLVAYSCNHKKAIDYTDMHVYQPDELQKLIDNAYKIEVAGAPTVQKTQNAHDSSTIIRTTQVYRVYVGVTKDGHLIPGADSTMAKKSGGGPIIITSSCEMMCTPVRAGESCNVEGCMPTDKCGCSQGSCGNNCTTDKICHQGLAGFGFGRGIIMF
jgi:hypothetical protein